MVEPSLLGFKCWFTFLCKASFLSSLTCDHGPVVHTGGQLRVLQACLLAGVGWAQPESARSSTLVWLVLWTHWTCRVCSPPPQLRLHTPHSPTDQLGRHSRNPLSQQAAPKSLEPAGDFKRLANCTIIAEDRLCFLSK